ANQVRTGHQSENRKGAGDKGAAHAASRRRRGDRMKRRQFVTLLGAVAAWPLASRAQQGERMRRIGVLMGVAADDLAAQARLAAFVQGLHQLGWTECRNVRIDIRWGAGDAERNRRLAAELVALVPDVILTHSTAAIAPTLRETGSIPIVFTI